MIRYHFVSHILFKVNDKRVYFWQSGANLWEDMGEYDSKIFSTIDRVDPNTFDHPAFIKHKFYKELLEEAE